VRSLKNVKELFDLTGKAAIITGGGTGLGRQMALGLAEAGANVALCSRRLDVCEATAEAIKKDLGVETAAVETDVTLPESVEKMTKTVVEKFGRIDILINNSGITWAGPPESLKVADWKRVIDSNVTGTFVCCQQVGIVMIRQHYGKIINISSVAGLTGSPSDLLDAISYSTSKGAVVAFTRDLASKWAKYNITVNALAPGYFHTHLTDWVIMHRSDRILARTPLHRLGTDDDLKGPAVLLASDASKYITGQIIIVDGGLSSTC
jgi:NAD(P)-dependent dehydrogenase (short-subunit alcohol dehydrogenase family)